MKFIKLFGIIELSEVVQVNAVSRNLRELVESRDLKQSALAGVAGVTEGSVSGWLSGRAIPRTKPLERIASFYRISMDDLTSERNGLYAKAHGLTDAPAGARAVSPSLRRTVPVRVLGAAHAGDPDEPWELDDEAMLYEDMAARHPNCYALRVNGSCMDRVFTSEDYIYVDPDMEPRDGSIAVMLIDGRSEVRRVKLGSGTMMLVSESHDPQPDIIVRAGDGQEASCQGVVFWWQARKEMG